MPAPSVEHALLSIGPGAEPYLADVPRGAPEHKVPDRRGIPPAVRGRAFARRGMDMTIGLPLFEVVGEGPRAKG